MILVNSVWILALAVNSVQSFGFRGFTYEGMKDPDPSKWKAAGSIKEKWITQRVDHFHIQDNRTWQMRFLENDAYFNGTGPILIMLGGEWAINEGFLRAGLMHEIGSQHGALMFYTEHRYYGKSGLFEDISTKNLKYLNVDQALADVAYFIQTIKEERKLDNTMVIVFGGSYSGNMAVWMRQKYSHMVQGALASSAPVFAKANFFEYLEIVATSLKENNSQCVTEISEAFETVEEIILTEPGKGKLRDEFNLCSALDSSISGLGTFSMTLTEAFSAVVQYNKVTNGTSGISKICNKMTNKTMGSPLRRLAKIVNNSDRCLDTNYESLLNVLKNDSWNGNTGIMRQWMFQTCTEYGYYQTTDSKKSIFGTILTFDYYTKLCEDIYGKGYDQILLDEGVKRTNVMYGGKFPDVKNVIFVNGNVDPWHALSILEDLNESSPSILINGASHCQDLQADNPSDPADLKKARTREREIIGQWIKAWKADISNEI